MTAAWIRMIPTSTDLGNRLLATSFATALASADCLTLTGVNETTDEAGEVSPPPVLLADGAGLLASSLAAGLAAPVLLVEGAALALLAASGAVDGATVAAGAAALALPALLAPVVIDSAATAAGGLASARAWPVASRWAAARSLMLVCRPSRLWATTARADASSRR